MPAYFTILGHKHPSPIDKVNYKQPTTQVVSGHILHFSRLTKTANEKEKSPVTNI
jgi:hypothetical protein